MRLLIAMPVVVGLSCFSQSAAAKKCAVDNYDHKKSVVVAKRCAGKLTISYKRSRSALVPNGVKSGTILFTGTEQAARLVKGQIRDFPPSCQSLAMSATGSRQAGSITLEVNYAIRDKTCQVIRHQTV